ncbi:hypothetical protein BJX63DRAFT_266169 [Aspergillus granulosus]|uniref:Uncharacterized protein n=1 Tax=Aspergillus granulosus TaxID=176169 RepID=A0ABR4H8X3_9EURO
MRWWTGKCVNEGTIEAFDLNGGVDDQRHAINHMKGRQKPWNFSYQRTPQGIQILGPDSFFKPRTVFRGVSDTSSISLGTPITPESQSQFFPSHTGLQWLPWNIPGTRNPTPTQTKSCSAAAHPLAKH